MYDRSMVMDGAERQNMVIGRADSSRNTFIEAYFETAEDGLVITDNSGKVVTVNNTFVQRTGRPASELIGLTVEEAAHKFLSDAYAQAVILAIESVLDGMADEPVSIQIRAVSVTVRPFAVGNGGTGVLCSVRWADLTTKTESDSPKHVSAVHDISFIDTIPDIIYRLNEQGIITYISPAVEQYGYQPEALIGKNIIDFVHPDDCEQAVYKLNDRRTGDRSTTLFEVRFLENKKAPEKSKNNGSSRGRWPVFLVSASGHYESTPPKSDGYLGTVGIARDISRRKHDEMERIRTASMLHNILRSSSRFGIIATDCNYRVMHINPAAETLFGFTPGTYLGKNVNELLKHTGVDGGRLSDAFAAALSYGTYQFTIAIEKTSQHVMLTVMPIRDVNARHSGYVLYAYDITDRKRAEEALLHYQRAVEGSTSLMAAMNSDGKYVFANQVFLEYYGLVRERVLGRTAGEVFGSERYLSEIEPYLTKCLQGEEVHIEQSCKCAKHGERFLSMTFYPLKGSNGEIKGAVTVAEDITTRRNTQKRIQETLAEKETLIEELRTAIDEVKTLRGFIPICAHCKKVRDDEGYWGQVEDYIRAHSEAEFSHSVCPDCMEEYFPEVNDNKDD